MCKIVCITNRKLCPEDFLSQIAAVAAAQPDAVVLREKDLNERDYTDLARQVQAVCQRTGTALTIHTSVRTALALGIRRIHLPLAVFRQMNREEQAFFSMIGVSCHSTEDAAEAEQRGASYITAGHIFETDCKAGLPGRGLAFLKDVCSAVHIPVYAIGGISVRNAGQVISAGADGVCLMSSLMKSSHPADDLSKLREVMNHHG